MDEIGEPEADSAPRPLEPPQPLHPPRLTIGVVGPTHRMVTLLTRAGHTVRQVEPENVGGVQLILLTATGGELIAEIQALEPHVRRGQIVAHADPAHGVQVLDPLEVRGVVPLAIADVAGMFFVTALDELGQTIGQLLAADMKGASIPVEEADRPLLGQVSGHVGVARSALAEIRRIVTDITGSEEVARKVIETALEDFR